MNPSRRTIADRATALRDNVGRRRTRLEQSRLLRFPLATWKRFGEIEGSHLALVIGANAFIAVIPLMIIVPTFAYPFSKTMWVAVDRALLQHMDRNEQLDEHHRLRREQRDRSRRPRREARPILH
mgnify:CR=1 FL=1